MNDWYELWSKAGANPNFRVENPQEYIQYFNWIDNWFKEYFFTKVSDFIFGILFLTLIIFATFQSKIKKSSFTYKGERFIYTVILLLLFEWFYNHPSLRYGGYQLLCLLLFLPVSNILTNNVFDKNIFFKTNVLLIIALTVFFGRNINRLINENNKYNFNPFSSPVYRITDNHFLLQKKLKEIVDNKNHCNSKNIQCVKNMSINVKQQSGYKIFFREKKE